MYNWWSGRMTKDTPASQTYLCAGRDPKFLAKNRSRQREQKVHEQTVQTSVNITS